MADEKFGIENLKKAAKFGITLGEDVAKALADGKLSLAEGVGLLPDFMGATDIVSSGQAIKDEFNDLSDTESDELNKYIDSEFDIPNDQLENKIEKAIHAAAAIYDLYLAFKEAA